MVVGRRRVAAASVATAYALHVYVLPNTIFDRPKPAIPPLSTHPHCPKVRMHSCSGYFSWVLVPRSFLSIFATRAGSLDPLSPGPCTLRRATRTLFAYIYYPSRATCRETPGNDASRPLPYSSLSPSIHPLLTFFFFSSYLFCSYYSLVSQPYARIEAVYIAYCGLSRN